MIVEELLKSERGPDAFGRNLRTVRAFRDMSQDELAEKSGVNQATIAMLERGHRQPRRGTVEKLAAALGVAVETLEG